MELNKQTIIDSLFNLNYIQIYNVGSGKRIWNFVDINDNLFHLELYSNKLYLYKGFGKKCDFQMIENITDIYDDLKRTNDIVFQNEKFKKQIVELIGDTTFVTRNIFGWNIKNSKIKLKITVEKFKKNDDKTVRLEYTIQNEIKDVFMTGKQILTFVKKHSDLILFKDIKLNNKQLTSKLNDLTINENKGDLWRSGTDDNLKLQLTKEKLEKIKRVLYISLPKERRISYQTCIPYNEDKQRLEKLMGMELDL